MIHASLRQRLHERGFICIRVTASFSMRSHLLFTRHRSRLLSKPCRFEIAAKSGLRIIFYEEMYLKFLSTNSVSCFDVLALPGSSASLAKPVINVGS